MSGTLNAIKAFLKRTPIYPPVRGYFQRRRYEQWVRHGRSGKPPHMAKQLTVKDYAGRFQLRTLVETGTYLGDMVDAVQSHFDRIYTIELGNELFERARRKFANRAKVTVLHGDSGTKIQEVLATLNTPTLFWLDAHYTAGLGVSGRATLDTPILAELTHIIQHPLAMEHVILIDDAHEFTGQNDYPPLHEAEAFIRTAGYDHFEVKENIIRIYKSRDSKQTT
jgi:hypothetical protein